MLLLSSYFLTFSLAHSLVHFDQFISIGEHPFEHQFHSYDSFQPILSLSIFRSHFPFHFELSRLCGLIRNRNRAQSDNKRDRAKKKRKRKNHEHKFFSQYYRCSHKYKKKAFFPLPFWFDCVDILLLMPRTSFTFYTCFRLRYYSTLLHSFIRNEITFTLCPDTQSTPNATK